MDQVLRGLEITGTDGESLGFEAGFEQFCELTRKVQQSGHQQFLCGNGASAAFSNHMALDWTKNGGVPTHSFSDSALLTAMGNDLGYEEAFSAPLSWYGVSGDQLVAISSSGNSPNILRTIAMARSKGMPVITLSGLKPDNASRKLGDLNFYIPAKTYGVVECAHQILLHVWIDKFMGITEWDRKQEQNMRKTEYIG
jgi:D-sedoheptulose 7-phosphate isomerase